MNPTKEVSVSELERLDHTHQEDNDTVAYVTTFVGAGLLIAAVLVMITAQVAAAGFPFILGATACLGVGISRFRRGRNVLPSAPNGERELLSAIRHHGGSITPAEAAMETSLTVRDADKMLSGLAGEGHLLVESHGGVLFSRLPSRNSRELEQWDDSGVPRSPQRPRRVARGRGVPATLVPLQP